MYDATGTYMMDTLNTTYTVSAVPDLDIPAGSSDVYQMIQEVKPGGIPDISVMKHTAVAGINEIKISAERLNAFPNPSSGIFTIKTILPANISNVEVYNSVG